MPVLLIGAAVALVILFGSQPAQDLVVVLPGANGHVGAVVVQNAGGRTVLDQAYAGSRSSGGRTLEPVKVSREEIDQVFAGTLAALPPRPTSFLLYFVSGTDELTDASKAEMQKMQQEIGRRGAPDIVVIGHTDRVGGDAENDRLSLQRAQRVRGDLVKLGISSERIRADGRGEREPLVSTADGVEEPRNRRVEINVR